MAVIESLTRQRRQGTDLDGGTVRLTEPTRIIKARAKIDRADKTAGKSYQVAVYSSEDDGQTWRLLGAGTHDTLADRTNKRTGLPEERPTCLIVELAKPLPAGTLIRTRYGVSDSVALAMEIETDAKAEVADGLRR